MTDLSAAGVWAPTACVLSMNDDNAAAAGRPGGDWTVPGVHDVSRLSRSEVDGVAHYTRT